MKPIEGASVENNKFCVRCVSRPYLISPQSCHLDCHLTGISPYVVSQRALLRLRGCSIWRTCRQRCNCTIMPTADALRTASLHPCSVHFRNCAEAAWEDVQAAVQATLAEQPELRLTRGRKVLELRPEVRPGALRPKYHRTSSQTGRRPSLWLAQGDGPSYIQGLRCFNNSVS